MKERKPARQEHTEEEAGASVQGFQGQPPAPGQFANMPPYYPVPPQGMPSGSAGGEGMMPPGMHAGMQGQPYMMATSAPQYMPMQFNLPQPGMGHPQAQMRPPPGGQ